MARHRSLHMELRRQVAQEFRASETLHGLSRRHDISRNPIRVWVRKYEAGVFDKDARAADPLQAYEARIAAIERLFGEQALELKSSKKARRSVARPLLLQGEHPILPPAELR